MNTATGDGGTDGEWELGTAPQLKAPLNDRTNPDEVVANYQYTKGNPDIAFVQIGNGGYGANFGGRNTPGHSGEIIIQAADDIRLHGGSFDNNSVQIGHGGRGSQGWHGYQADQLDLARPDYSAIDVDGKGNITITAGGIFEVLAGRGESAFSDNEQYAQVGHGGYDADGNHQGNIRVSRQRRNQHHHGSHRRQWPDGRSRFYSGSDADASSSLATEASGPDLPGRTAIRECGG
ncbi:MAG: hypothetical protein R3F31_03680 [Verrucomicrobiales bacterium]